MASPSRDFAETTHFAYRTPYGPVTIRTCNEGITDVALGDVALAGPRQPSALSNQAATELLEYFAGKRRSFDVPLALQGSAFQRAVWDALSQVPYGETRTSAQLADLLGKPGSYRAVGAALRKTRAASLVPGHRLVGADGRIPGADKTAQLRRALLEMERKNKGLPWDGGSQGRHCSTR